MTPEEAHHLYVLLIEHAKSNNPQKRTFGFDRHHIIPKCKSCGGHKTASWNIVFLSWRQHFEAHMLLVEIYPEHSQQRRDMATALNMMCGEKFDMTSEEYEYVRNVNSKTQCGKKQSKEVIENRANKNRGQKRTLIQRVQMSQRAKETEQKPEVKLKQKLAKLGKKHTKEH